MINIRDFSTPRAVMILIGLSVVIPWNLWQGFGQMFAFHEKEPLSSWVFVYVSFFLNVLAVLVSFWRPRVGALWMLTNIGISLGMAAIFLFESAREPDLGPPLGPPNGMLLDFASVALRFWFLNFAFAALLLFFGRRKLRADET